MPSDHVTAIEGENARVVCEDPNVPPLEGTAQWSDPNGNSVGAGRFLFIPNITRTQAGDYLCELTSFRGEVLSVTVTITVHCKLRMQALWP